MTPPGFSIKSDAARAFALALLGIGCSSAESKPSTIEAVRPACETVRVSGSRPTFIDGGGNTFCAILEDGGLRCWGYDLYGPYTPVGEVFDEAAFSGAPMRIAGATCLMAVDVGEASTCAIAYDGTALCWGFDSFELLGNGPDRGYEAHPRAVVDLPPVDDVRVAASAGALTRDGVFYQWGSVHASAAQPLQSAPAPFEHDFGKIEGFDCTSYRCVIHEGGKLSCWGVNVFGNLGDGTNVPRDLPKEVMGVGRVLQVGVESGKACAVNDAGEVWCWGDGTFGQLGNGDSDNSFLPVRVVGIDDAVGVELASLSACALHRDGRVSCWGGQDTVGPIASPKGSPIPVEVPGVEDVVQLAATRETMLALRADGMLLWWGEGLFHKQIVDETPRPVPWDEVLEEP